MMATYPTPLFGMDTMVSNAANLSTLYVFSADGNYQTLGQITNVSVQTATPTYITPSVYYPITSQVTFGTGIVTNVDLNWYNTIYNNIHYYNYVVDETEEQKALRELESKKRKAAEAKAEELLLMCLNDLQKELYLKHGYLEINTDRGKYRIHKGWAKNIEKVGADGKTEHKYCIHPSDVNVPIFDNMLAQKLMLEYNEKEFLRIANKWSV